VTAVGLDVGTSGVKGIALAEDGAILARAEAGYPLATPRPGWAEQHPDLWWGLRGRCSPISGMQLASRPASGCRDRCTGS